MRAVDVDPSGGKAGGILLVVGFEKSQASSGIKPLRMSGLGRCRGGIDMRDKARFEL